MKAEPGAGMGRDPAVNGPGTTIEPSLASGTGAEALGASLCGVCLKPLPPGAGQKFCSCRCRQMHWWAREMAKALHAGMADGLANWITELGRMARERKGRGLGRSA